MRTSRIIGAAVASAALLGTVGLTAASSASAATAAPAASINGPTTNRFEAGYEINADQAFNQSRGTVSIPAGSKTSVAFGLQQGVNGGATYMLALIYSPAQQGFLLEEGAGLITNFATGTPLGVGPAFFHPIASLNTPANHILFSSITGGTYYLEVRESTKLHVVNLVAGPSETDAATLSTLFNGVHTDFEAPFVGGATFQGINLPANTEQATFSRVGVTTPQDGTRVTFDHYSLDETIATGTGGPVTIGNPATLIPGPALPGVGSAFGLVSGS